MIGNNPSLRKSFNPWHFIWITVVISELFTAVVSTIQHYFAPEFDLRYILKVGAIDSLFVPLIVAPIIIYFLRSETVLKKINTQLENEIAERKRIEEVLRESEEKFSLFMDYLPATVFIKGEEGRTLFVNKHMKENLGAKDWIGRTTSELFPKTTADLMIADDNKTMSDGYNMSVETVPHIDGTEHIYETQKFVIKRTNKTPLLGGLALDITERRQAEHEREKLIADLQKALAEIKTLKGILPICSVCKKVRDDEGSWKEMEMFIQDRSEAEFSHGYCPECAKKALDEANEFTKKNKP
jgi:PAS domain S-box-containing protein